MKDILKSFIALLVGYIIVRTLFGLISEPHPNNNIIISDLEFIDSGRVQFSAFNTQDKAIKEVFWITSGTSTTPNCVKIIDIHPKIKNNFQFYCQHIRGIDTNTKIQLRNGPAENNTELAAIAESITEKPDKVEN